MCRILLNQINHDWKKSFPENEENLKMEENQYSIAGWISIAQAVIFPLAFIISVALGVIGLKAFGYRGPMFGPSDLLFLAITAMSVYTLLMFRRLLNERYDYHAIDTLILLAICWGIVYQLGSIALRIWLMMIWPIPEIAMTIISLTFFSIGMIAVGIIDILIAVRLLQIRQTVNELIRAFTYVTMAAGLCEVSVVLSPIALLLAPVSFVILGMIFLKKEEVEFV
jgi:hypothetical protein